MFAEKENYDKALDYLERVFSLNALQPQDQLDLQFQIAQLYLATDKWNEGHEQLLRWFKNAEEMGFPPGSRWEAHFLSVFKPS